MIIFAKLSAKSQNLDSHTMDRRDFIKKTAVAAAGVAMTTPVAGMLQSASSQLPTAEGKTQPTTQIKGKMKVLLINGSPRRDGNTFSTLNEIAEQLQKHGVESEIFQIGTKPVRSCINCGGCRRNGDNKCVFDDDICNTVSQKLAEADALVVGSPVYYGQPNGGVLSLMQRVFFSAGSFAQNKPAAAVAVCRRGGATATFQAMNMMFQMMNMPVVTSQYWNIVYGAAKGESKLDTEGMQTMRTLANNMAWLLEKIHAGGKTVPERESDWKGMNFIR